MKKAPFKMKGPSGFSKSPIKKNKPIKGEKGMSKKVQVVKNKKVVDTKYFIGETPTDSTTFNVDLKRRIKEGKRK
jgi:hypothetical protein|tara:strand:+ start:642 stop:866 length:225 start_codon:yes stop_codon:yes gene_type:complete